MRPDVKKLDEHLQECNNDRFVTNLWYRHYQHLDLGYSHWRESYLEEMKSRGMTLDEIYDDLPKSKSSMQEAEFLTQHPGVDANLMRLRQKYGSHSMGD